MIKTLSFSIALVCISMLSWSQGPVVFEVVLEWSEDPTVVDVPHGKMGFKDASWNRGIPSWHLNKEVPLGSNSVSFDLSNLITENVSESDLTESQKRNSKADFDVKMHISSVGRQSFLIASGAGLRKNENGNYERLLSVNLDVALLNIAQANRTVTWSEHSVLAEGEWYKIAIAEDGIYRLSRSFLQSLGVDVSSVDPQAINIYGNGGAMLPFENADFRFDDPQKNSIFVSGEQDGSFDSNDYILFYGQGADIWEFNDATENFEHQKHHYSDSAYYFIRVDDDLPKRITTVSTPETSDFDVTSFRARSFIETEQVNLAKSGRTFFGESFDLDPLTTPFNFSAPNLLAEPANLDVEVAGRSLSVSSEFTVNAYGEQELLVIDNTSTSAIANLANVNGTSIGFTPTAGAGISVSLSFDKGVASAEGWLDYLRVNYQRKLRMAGSQLEFRSVEAFNQNGNANYQIEAGNTLSQVWDVSDPQNVKVVPFDQDAGGLRTFNYPSDQLYEFVAFSDFGYLEPQRNGRVENQDLHGLTDVDMVVITTPVLRPAAEELAALHAEEGLEIVIVEPRQVFNEFSSGNDDVTAFKMLMKMLYDRANGDQDLAPKYLQIFGDGNFNNRHLADNSSYVISYQSLGSLSPTDSYISDDYYGFLDDNAGEGLGELMQIGVGRIPASNLSEAYGYVNKVRLYMAPNSSSDGGAYCLGDAGNSAFGSWRNLISFIADDRDGNGPPNELMHMTNSNSLSSGIYEDYNDYDVVKIYMDAYQQVSTPGGERYPEASEAVRRRVEEGALIVNYVGHGGERGWAHERLLDLPTIQSWTNLNRLPLFVTATCELARYDDPEFKSAGELIVMNESGGAIAMLTTTRIVFSGANQQINQAFFDVALEDQNIEDLTLGFISMTTKNDGGVSNTSNKRNFSLLGDVALRLNYPKFEVQTTEINGIAIDPVNPETVRSLQEVRVKGFVSDEAGSILEDFDGFVYPSVYDKRSVVTTLNNDQASADYSFDVYRNLIYRGAASVNNGEFEFSFVVPKDIDFEFGTGRISYYCVDGDRDGHGHSEDFEIGGVLADAELNEVGPEIQLYLNDSSFVFGGTTDQSPFVYAKLFDENGINTVGNGIGHDLKAVIDQNTNDPIILNEAYEADLNTYRSGEVRYQLTELSEGSHNLSLKVWDVHNNSSEAYTEFIVSDNAELALDHVLNYPNPFTTYTEFFFEHNQACSTLDVEIQVFSISGALVKTMRETVLTEGFRSSPIAWDGKDDFGDNIGRGVYVYKVKVTTPDGLSADYFERLVILK